MEGLVGLGHDISPAVLDEMRPAAIATHLSKYLLERYLLDGQGQPQYHLYYKLQPVVRRWMAECFTTAGGTKAGMLTYPSVASRAAALIHSAIVQQGGEDGTRVVKAVLDPYNPVVVTDHVQFITSKTDLWDTLPGGKSHVNYVVGDSGWETVVRIDDGHGPDDPLMLVVEVKGERDVDDQIKAETMRSLWVPGVNNLGDWGRWGFVELKDAFGMEADYEAAVDAITGG